MDTTKEHDPLRKRPIYFWLVLAALLGIDLAVVYFVATVPVVRGVLALPIPALLIAATVKLLRDEIEHSRRVELQDRQAIYDLSVASHMADVAFDKHVAFCEQYLSVTREGINKLFQEGPSRNALSISYDLHSIRNKFQEWLSDDTHKQLIKFERKLDAIGITAMKLNTEQDEERRQQLSQQLIHTFAAVTTIEEEEAHPMEPDLVAAGAVLRHLRGVLGTEQLIKLRQFMLDKAAAAAQKR